MTDIKVSGKVFGDDLTLSDSDTMIFMDSEKENDDDGQQGIEQPVKKSGKTKKKLSVHHIIESINTAHLSNPHVADIFHSDTSFGLLGDGIGPTDNITASRKKIVKASAILIKASTFMVFYSLFYLGLKINDFTDLKERLIKSDDLWQEQNNNELKQSYSKFSTLFYEVNCISMGMAVFVVLATIYIRYSLVKSKVFSGLTYRKFIWLCFFVVISYIILFAYFMYSFFGHVAWDIKKLLDGINSIGYLTTDSHTRLLFEWIISIGLFVGLYFLLWISNEIEAEIVRLDMLRAKSNTENSDMVD